MSYVFYDVETTGLRKRFDQIVQFAAVRTDLDLNIVDQFEIQVRLSPHIIPAPTALKVTGTPISSLLDPLRPTVYDAMRAINEKMSEWSPAIFIGYNSIGFDEEVLRHSLYQALLPAYLTTGRNNRADALTLARVTASLRPEILASSIGSDGRRSFRLAEIAAANGIVVNRAHEAMADVKLTLALCKHIKEAANDLWSHFVRFSKKSTVDEFISGESVFAFCHIRGNAADIRIVTKFGTHTSYQGNHYAFDLAFDPADLAELSDPGLSERLSQRPSALVVIKSNASPLLCALHDCNEDMLGGLNPDEAEARAEKVQALAPRLESIVRASERQWPPSEHVEEQLYGFPHPNADDAMLIAEFHEGSWTRREEIAAQLSELRLKRLARRIVYCNAPESLSGKSRANMKSELDRRLLQDSASQVPWLTARQANTELQELLSAGALDSESEILQGYGRYLHDRFGPLS